MTQAPPKIYFVRAMSPKGRFRRCGVDFTTDEWRPIRVAGEGEEPNALADVPVLSARDVGRIHAETVSSASKYHGIMAELEPDPERQRALRFEATRAAAREQAEPGFGRLKAMLAIRPAAPEEVEAYLRDRFVVAMPPEQLLERERARNADLEARLMKLELAQFPNADGKSTPTRKDKS